MLTTAIGVAALLLPAPLPPKPQPQPPKIVVLSGSRPDGSATDLWLALLRRRLTPTAFDSVSRLRLQRTPDQEAWARLVQSRATTWSAAADSLGTLFPLPPLHEARIILGNRGGEDAMTYDSVTMAFDLAALQRTYGPADLVGNADKLDRFFRHEFVHLLQKRWLSRHPYTPHSPLQRALLDAWAEGLGNYFSLSDTWRPTESRSAPQTVRTLAELEPRFLARFAALACADSATAGPLLAGLSSGPFTQKWGALPVALWLLADLERDSTALRTFATTGPTAVWALAEHHLPALADSLAAVRARAEECAPTAR